jgi:hypothetical protein
MTETAFTRARREFPSLITDSRWMWAWLTAWGFVATGAGVYLAWDRGRTGVVVITLASLAAGLVTALVTAFLLVWARAPVWQRNEARKLVAQLQETSGFPDVVLTTKQVLVVGTVDSETYAARETRLAIGIHAVNRERELRAILEFKPFVQTGEPRPGIWPLHTSRDTRIANPLKLDPQDIQEGELIVAWTHDMDFVLGRDLSEADAIKLVTDNLHLALKDHLSGVSVGVDVPGTWRASMTPT